MTVCCAAAPVDLSSCTVSIPPARACLTCASLPHLLHASCSRDGAPRPVDARTPVRSRWAI